MPHIFKYIRKKIITENKSIIRNTNYFKYAIGEIVLVVIGILIALQINNWNGDRKKVIAEKEFYEGIKNDLTQDKEYIEFILKSMNPKVEAFNLLNDKNLILDQEKMDFVDTMLQTYFFMGQRTFYPVSGSFESAVSGNEINAFKNKDITRSIIKLYNSTYPRLIDNANMLDQRWDQLTEKYIHERRIKHFNCKNNAQLSQILDDMYYHFVMLIWYQNVLKNANTEIDELIKKLND